MYIHCICGICCADSCQYSYSDREVKIYYSYSTDASNVYGHGNVTITLVCGRTLVSLVEIEKCSNVLYVHVHVM